MLAWGLDQDRSSYAHLNYDVTMFCILYILVSLSTASEGSIYTVTLTPSDVASYNSRCAYDPRVCNRGSSLIM